MTFIDEQAFLLLRSLPVFSFGKLIRPKKAELKLAKEAFITRGELPRFTFPQAEEFDTSAYERELERVRTALVQIELPEAARLLYAEKLDELADRCALIKAVQTKDDAKVTQLSEKLYGPPVQSEQELTDEFSDVLARANRMFRHREPVDADLFAEMVRRTCEHYQFLDWRIRLTAAPSIRIGRATIDGRPPVIHIPKSLKISRSRAARLLTHELEVHALRTENGLNSGLHLLSRGLAGYIRTDEGLAVYYQQKLRTPEAIDAGFWDAWATVLTRHHTMREVYATLYAAQLALSQAIKDPNPDLRAADVAWRLCTRVYRGIHDPSIPGVGFMRDHVYRSGLAEVRRVIEDAGHDILPLLFVGHANIKHLAQLRELGITSARTPDMIGKKIVNEVMREHKRTSNAQQNARA